MGRYIIKGIDKERIFLFLDEFYERYGQPRYDSVFGKIPSYETDFAGRAVIVTEEDLTQQEFHALKESGYPLTMY